MWRFVEKGKLASGGYPTKSSRLFPILKNVHKVDAAFESSEGGSVTFTSGWLSVHYK